MNQKEEDGTGEKNIQKEKWENLHISEISQPLKKESTTSSSKKF